MNNDVLAFIPKDATLNTDTGNGFTCMVCGHWLYESETEWGDLFVCRPNRFGHMHGRDPFHFCPHCGAHVLTPDEWAAYRPQDQGKTFTQIAKGYVGDFSDKRKGTVLEICRQEEDD